jgi:hypothetical protein
MAFLKAQKYEKRGQFEKVIPALSHLIKGSDVLTVILISDGTEEVRGTTFDDRINNAFKLWKTQQQDARMPFVIVFRAQKGEVTDCTVNPAPWVVELPPLPPEPQIAKVGPKRAAVPAPKPSPPALPPLILSGKKPEAQPILQTTETNLSSTTSVRAPEASLSPGTQTALVPSAQPAITPNAISGTAPAATEAQSDSRAEKNAASGKSDSAAKQASNAVLVTAQPTPATGSEPAQVATVASRGALHTSATLWIVGGLLVLTALAGFVLVWRSRSRPGVSPSLITESFDRRRK